MLLADMITCMFDKVAIYLMLDHLTSELFADMMTITVYQCGYTLNVRFAY